MPKGKRQIPFRLINCEVCEKPVGFMRKVKMKVICIECVELARKNYLIASAEERIRETKGNG